MQINQMKNGLRMLLNLNGMRAVSYTHLFLFCGKRTDRIKGLVWEGDGFLLLYKRLNIGGFSWPRTKEEAMEITPEQFQMLMQGLSIVAKHPIKELKDPPKTM